MQGFKNLAPFTNAVLRSFARSLEANHFEIKEGTDKLGYLSTKYSYPKWLVGYWNKYYGDRVYNMCEFLNTSPMVSIAVNTHKISRDALKEALELDGVTVFDGTVSKNSLLLKNTSNIGNNKNFRDGDFWVMDESSQRALEHINFDFLRKDAVILDLCASPGGKSFFLKANLPRETKVIACDVFLHKLELLKRGFERLGYKNFEVILNDAKVFNPSFVEMADIVLVDAPCSGFGLLRKKPDIKYSKTYEDILALQKVQAEILETSKNYVKDKGKLVYSTCTLSYLENEIVIEEFLSKNDNFVVEKMETTFPMAKNRRYLEGRESDGFFVCILRKVK